MLFCSQKGRKVSQRGGRSEKMVNIKNEMGKEGPKLAVIKSNENELILSKYSRSLSVTLISAVFRSFEILVCGDYFKNKRDFFLPSFCLHPHPISCTSFSV